MVYPIIYPIISRVPAIPGGAGFRLTIHSSYGMDHVKNIEKLDDFCHPMRSQEDIFGNKEGLGLGMGIFQDFFWGFSWGISERNNEINIYKYI